MKKLFMLFILMLVLVMAACGQTEKEADSTNGGDTNAGETENTDAEDTGENDQAAVKKALLNNYLNVAKTVRPHQATINMYLEALNNPEVEATTIETSKVDAIAAAEEVATALDGFTIENLDEEKTAQFNEALSELKMAYEEYATALEAEEVDVSAAEDKITASNDKLTIPFEEAGLHAPNLSKEIN